jgi:two-component sensor histidine kinase
VLAAAVAVLTGLLQRALASALDPFVTFLAAVCLSAFVAGSAPAVLTASLGFIFFLVWRAPADWLGSWPQRAIPLGEWVAVAAGLIALIHRLQSALAQARDSNAETASKLDAEKVRFLELQHRIGNHMQVIASILTLQKAKIRSDPSSALTALDETRERVVNMSRIHRRLYDPAAGSKSVQQHLQDLCADFAALAAPHHIHCSVAPLATISDPFRLMTLSLLIGEAITNSAKYAFEDEQTGTISVELERAGDLYVVKIRDSGRGLTPGFDPANSPGLGFKIMQSLAGQLAGRLEILQSDGVTIRVAFGA